jgi:hypothetical protein
MTPFSVMTTVLIPHGESYEWKIKEVQDNSNPCPQLHILAESGEGDIGICGSPDDIIRLGESLLQATRAYRKNAVVRNIFGRKTGNDASSPGIQSAD